MKHISFCVSSIIVVYDGHPTSCAEWKSRGDIKGNASVIQWSGAFGLCGRLFAPDHIRAIAGRCRILSELHRWPLYNGRVSTSRGRTDVQRKWSYPYYWWVKSKSFHILRKFIGFGWQNEQHNKLHNSYYSVDKHFVSCFGRAKPKIKTHTRRHIAV